MYVFTGRLAAPRRSSHSKSGDESMMEGLEKPTEEERLAWEEQRQQREKLSNLMGQYLLKGYRMLGVNCEDCGNILLRTRDGVDFCINCTELQGRDPKHNEATSDVGGVQSSENPRPHSVSRTRPSVGGTYTLDTVSLSQDVLVAKLQWASKELANTASVEHSTQLCLLIKTCADALKSINELQEIPQTTSQHSSCM